MKSVLQPIKTNNKPGFFFGERDRERERERERAPRVATAEWSEAKF